MIRDPSDGSVREEISPEANKINAVTPKPAPKGIGLATGIRQPTRTDAMRRLEYSREWLKNYHARKETTHARGNDGKELQAAGHSVEDVREAESGPSA